MDDSCGLNVNQGQACPCVNAHDSVHEKIYHLSTEKLIDQL